MALRLRRGTDAERLLITPLQGELIYATDTKLLFVGDGTTPGGTLVTGSGGDNFTINSMLDTDLTGLANDEVLIYNSGTEKWEPGVINVDDLGDALLGTPQENDILTYDGENWTNSDIFIGSIAATGTLDGDVTGSVFADDSTLLVDGISGTLSNGVIVIDNETISSPNLFLGGEIENSILVKANTDTLIVNRAGYDGGLSVLGTISIEGARGTKTSPTALQVGDFIGNYVMSAYDGADYTVKSIVLGQIDTATVDNPLPGKILFALHDYEGNYTAGVSVNSRHHLEAPVMKFTPFADTTARDAALPTGVVEAGMVIYLTATNKLQINNDGTTSGWVDLH